MKKIILINGSPRKKGNSNEILNKIETEITAKGHSVIRLNLRDMKFEGCIDCRYCSKNRGCILKDDIQNIYQVLDDSDGTIVVTPVYFDSVPAKLKAFVDRMQAVYSSKYVLEDSLIDRDKIRKGFVVSVGGAAPYETQFLGIKLVMDFFYKSINADILEYISISDTDEKAAIESEDKIEMIKKTVDEMLK